jgi:hypothetical protein
MENIYLEKYLKYKSKYLELLQFGSAAAAAPQPTPQPFLGNHKTLYIAIPIERHSQLGQNLFIRDAKLQFSDYVNVLGVHLSLLQVSVRTGSQLDRLLSDPINYGIICNTIVGMFRTIINNSSATTDLTLTSIPRTYKVLGTYYCKMYTNTISAASENLRKQVNEYLLQLEAHGIRVPPTAGWWANNVDLDRKKQNKHNILAYKVFSLRGQNQNPVIAQSQYFTAWEPHLSIFKIPKSMSPTQVTQKGIAFMRNGKSAISQIRLWPATTTNPALRGNGGDITHIYFVYDFKSHLFIRL